MLLIVVPQAGMAYVFQCSFFRRIHKELARVRTYLDAARNGLPQFYLPIIGLAERWLTAE